MGDGAVEFAASQMVNILPIDYLVSTNARLRWESWRRDLNRVADEDGKRNRQTYSPRPSPSSDVATALPQAYHGANVPSPPETPPENSDFRVLPTNISKHAAADGPAFTSSSATDTDEYDHHDFTDDNLAYTAQGRKRPRISRSGSHESMPATSLLDLDPVDSEYHAPISGQHIQGDAAERTLREDHITDTVGAIAIDCYGRIAAASSSGGIGMKHKGRCGPAALVGISTAVIPADPEDPEEQSIATVTSGTGEHMATTAAAQTAADRILSCTRKSHGKLEPCTEDEALYSMIKNDFMRHPGVQNSPCQGAIGLLCVKKCKSGIYFYFGHNTDSFALASMHSDQRKPVCVMSRTRESGLIAQGGSVVRARRTTKGH